MPAPDRGIVTISDAAYYPQLRLLLASLFEQTPCEVKVFDIGLTPPQLRELHGMGIQTFTAPASAERFVDPKAQVLPRDARGAEGAEDVPQGQARR